MQEKVILVYMQFVCLLALAQRIYVCNKWNSGPLIDTEYKLR
jgi:hypothetical protein